MSTPTSGQSASRTSSWVGIALGIVLLGLVAAFAIGLPKAVGDTADAEPAPVTLPDELPGGYPAADDPAAFKDSDYADQAEDIAKQQKAATDYGNDVLPDALGHPAATRTYVADGTTPVFVQVFRADGGAFAPETMVDPTTSQGQGGTTMEAVGDGACILTYGQSQTDGTDVGDPSTIQCQISRDGLTVQIEASGMKADDIVDTGDALLDELVKQDQE
ncbi:hypothetical protein [Nocardioides mangrovi]|uniref:DUF4245 domain-containing protein n=1 Tax=Nocardioides mangrovi TaxID=2874580 RepID=A0ABS7UI19_9ACTN|nr:hypothetical protein [Nocardioides mangrovi]MBZ5740432.1 hypothetical protein [Nocardioides mangrovi]